MMDEPPRPVSPTSQSRLQMLLPVPSCEASASRDRRRHEREANHSYLKRRRPGGRDGFSSRGKGNLRQDPESSSERSITRGRGAFKTLRYKLLALAAALT